MALPQTPSKPIIQNYFPVSVGIALNLCTSGYLRPLGLDIVDIYVLPIVIMIYIIVLVVSPT